MGKQAQINGKNFEKQLCKHFSERGYYVLYMEKSTAGAQPCDIVIIKHNIATLIEAKNLDNQTGIFTLSRIEQNQRLAFKKFKSCENTNFILAINWNGGVYLIDFDLLQFYDKSIPLKDIQPNWRWEDENTN